MDKGPHIIPLVPGGVPVIIHASQGEIQGLRNEGSGTYDWKYIDVEFKLLTSDNQYYEFLPGYGSDNSGPADALYPADLFYVRPDGVSGHCQLKLSRSLYRTGNTADPGGYRYSEPYSLFLRGEYMVDELTEVAGDVSCEIVVYRGSNTDVGRRESSANFIIRVEPKPTASAFANMTISNMPIDQTNNQNNETTGSYYAGDPDDPALISWEDVVHEADAGDLMELLTPGQLIRPVKLKSGELMGMRCVHVLSYNVAYFEPYHLFLAPKQYNNSFSSEPQYVYASEAAGLYLGDGMIGDKYFYQKDQEWKSLLPYSVSSRIVMLQAFFTPDYVFGGERNVNGVRMNVQLDMYKTAEGRVKTSSNGVARDWYLVDILGGTWIVEESGADGRANYERGDDIYVNPIFYIEGRTHTIQPIDVQSWQDVKTAAAKGKLKSSTLQAGQLMPELPTVGVLRCVHIEDNWAAFDQTVLKETCVDNLPIISYNDNSGAMSTLTDDEKDIFTILQESTTNNVTYRKYAQDESGYNLGYATTTTNYNLGRPSCIYNQNLKNTRFNYYEDGDATKRIKNGTNGTPVSYWGNTSGSGSVYESFFFNTSGGVGTFVNGTTKRTTYHVNPVFIVGELS